MATCINCGTELKPVWKDDDPDTTQLENALPITFGGGYGMFHDDNDQGIPTVFVCHDCAHEMCRQYPWMERLLDPARSHAHTSEFWAAHPDHEGWDKLNPAPGRPYAFDRP
jgi:hypothetical protein